MVGCCPPWPPFLERGYGQQSRIGQRSSSRTSRRTCSAATLPPCGLSSGACLNAVALARDRGRPRSSGTPWASPSAALASGPGPLSRPLRGNSPTEVPSCPRPSTTASSTVAALTCPLQTPMPLRPGFGSRCFRRPFLGRSGARQSVRMASQSSSCVLRGKATSGSSRSYRPRLRHRICRGVGNGAP